MAANQNKNVDPKNAGKPGEAPRPDASKDAPRPSAPQGGSPATGGASAKGEPSKGGVGTTAGATPTGSTAPTGGTAATGSTAAAGSATPAGGTAPAGGRTASGDANVAGGPASVGGTEKEGETSATGGEDLHAPFAAAHNRYFQEFHDAYVAGTAKAHEAHRKLMEGEAEAHRAFWERCEEARQALLRTMAEITGEDDAAVQARFDAHRAYNDALGAAEQERVHREEGLREDYVRVAREIETVGYEGLRSLLGEYLTRFQKALADLPVREIDARDVMIISHSMATIASHAAALPPR